MTRRFIPLRRAGVLAVVLATAVGIFAGTAPARAASPAEAKTGSVRQLCAGPGKKGEMACQSLARTDITGHKGLFAPQLNPNGYGPVDLQSAYALPSTTGGAGRTVAIVDAFDNPNAEADLAIYRAQYGLTPCTTANGCFRKVNQNGLSSPLPTPNAGWAAEIALDIDMVSAICPNCSILLVESNSNYDTDLYTAVNTAVAMGAKFVSNSWGGSESSSQTSDDANFNHPGVAITASSGDSGYGVIYPAASQYVTAVGGTSLTHASNTRGWSETVWSGAGSGCSAYDPKPAFQTDPGCPRRTVADVSAVGDPATGVAVYNTYQDSGWAVYGGTSVSAPIIASVYALAGDPLAASYPNTYPYGTPTALNDVTSGSNGSCGGSYLCTAATGYDGPTGLGTPNGVLAFGPAGPHGTISGTVTDAAGGTPLAGAVVTAGTASATTDAAGHYALSVATGTYDVTAVKYGYATATVSTVVVTDGGTTAVNIALSAVPRATISGTVTDASGHGWPLYARISVAGVPGGPVFTDPATGHYSIALPTNASYTMHISAQYPGYQASDQTVALGDTDTVADVGLHVDVNACSAAGYSVHVAGTSEAFESGGLPAGWTVVNHTADGGWGFTDDGHRGNLTGGSGGFAMIDSDHLGIGKTQDTELITPATDLSGSSNPVVGFNSDYRAFGSSFADVDVTIDGGTTWTSVLHQTASVRGPKLIQIPLPMAAGQPAVQVRFHYKGTWAYWWEVDNAFLGNRSCDPIHGGLLVGSVKDANTGLGLSGSTVTSTEDPSLHVTSAPTPDDPNLGDGFYWLFSPLTGGHPFTAAHGGYQSQTQTPNVAVDSATRQDFSLGAAHLTITPTTVDTTVKMGGTATTTVTVTNDGSGTATVSLGEQDNGFSLLRAQQGGAPLNLIRGDFSPHQLVGGDKPALATTRPTATPYAAPWTNLANFPTVVMDNAMGYNNGKVYSVGGTDGASTLASGAVLDPLTGAWSPIASMATPRERPTGAFLNGRFYVVGGWSASGSALASLEIYDPASNSWSAGASMPTAFAASAAGVVNGKMYVVGGCNASTCGFANVYSYDPASDRWSQVANYPQATSWEACGGIGGMLYCAGGTTDASDTKAGYVYNPATDSWSGIADLPIDNWAMGYAAANGVLLVSGGVTAGTSALTNQGFAFDPGTGSWTAIANSNSTLYRGGSACGFYKVGGSTGGFNAVASGEVLPGLDQCAAAADVAWLSESPTSFTVAAGASVTVTLTLDAAASVVSQPGDYQAKVTFTTDTPYQVAPVDVTMTVTPPKSWGKIAGTVTGVSCNGTSAPLAGATVQIDSWAAHYTLKTDKDGKYALWLDKRNNPLTVIVAKDGWQPQTKQVKISAGTTTTVDWALRSAAC